MFVMTDWNMQTLLGSIMLLAVCAVVVYCNLNNCTVHLDNIKVFYLPNDAQ